MSALRGQHSRGTSDPTRRGVNPAGENHRQTSLSHRVRLLLSSLLALYF